MKKYLRYFKIPLIIFVLVLIAGISCKVILQKQGKNEFVRNNPECTTERVFDYADVLTEEEEQKLREKIAQAEKNSGTDIVIVTLNESLEDYAKSYEPIIGRVSPYQYTMVYADNFYDEKAYGFNKPYGDGVILVDNWYREKDGNVYSWMSTSGKAEQNLTSKDIDRILDDALRYVDDDPADAYGYFVELVCDSLTADNNAGESLGGWVSVVIGIVAGIIFFFVNFGGRKGKKTVETRTYVKNGKPVIRERQDIFLNKTVTRRKVVSENKGGSGSGHHVSAGGHSHGGGGHSR